MILIVIIVSSLKIARKMPGETLASINAWPRKSMRIKKQLRPEQACF